jgi:hypothetical protein
MKKYAVLALVLVVLPTGGCKETKKLTAKETFLKQFELIQARDFGGLWDLYAPGMQQAFVAQREKLLSMPADKFQQKFGVSKADMEKLEGKEFLAKLLEVAPLPDQVRNPPAHAEIDNGDEKAVRVVARWKTAEAECEQPLVRIEETWKIEGAALCKREEVKNVRSAPPPVEKGGPAEPAVGE